MIEIWKDIKSYENIYQISNFGNVRSLNRCYYDSNGFKHEIKQRQLKPAINKYGYLQVGLSLNNKIKSFTIHVLVANAFINNVENKPTVNHKDGNKLNNFVNNLEWATKSEQATHALEHNLRKLPNSWVGKFGSEHCRSKSVIKYDLNNVELKKYESIIEAANEYNVNSTSIIRVCSGKGKTCCGFIWKYEIK